MASLVKDLIDAGIHFGHRATHWNPKMAPYIFGKRNKIHIIDVRATIKGLLLARKFVTRTVASGKDILFVGTKRQARACLEQHVSETQMHWVTERWLGGTLTNFRTIRDRLKRLEELEALEESGEINKYSKKMESQLRREKNKICRNLNGLRRMSKLPGAMVVIDVNREANALKEARKLGIPTICLIDTDSDPDMADIPIPGNDDAMRAIEVVTTALCAAIQEGKQARAIQNEGKDKDSQASGEPQRKRSSRAQFRASDAESADVAQTPEVAENQAAATPEPVADAPSVPDQAPAEPVAETPAVADQTPTPTEPAVEVTATQAPAQVTASTEKTEG